MHLSRLVAPAVYWVGDNDRRINRFENLFPLTEGISYNSYLIMDEKTVLLDTVDAAVSRQFLENVTAVLAGRPLDYLIINHMEPDHCANIEALMLKYPELVLIGNVKTFQLYEQFYDFNDSNRYQLVKDGEELSIGTRTLKFFLTPMVHWPEVMMTYDLTHQILFSADGFGTFGAINGNLFIDELDFTELILPEARRYYVNIIGKFGGNVTAALKKLAPYEIKMICSLHGPIYRQPAEIKTILDYYEKWSSSTPEIKSVLLLYGSMYGNTENAVEYLAQNLAATGLKHLRIMDVSAVDASFIISEMWRYSHVVFAGPNYNTELYFKLDNLIREALALNYKNRKVSLITNVSWGGKALATLQGYFAENKSFELIGEPVIIKSALKPATASELETLAQAIVADLKNQG